MKVNPGKTSERIFIAYSVMDVTGNPGALALSPARKARVSPAVFPAFPDPRTEVSNVSGLLKGPTIHGFSDGWITFELLGARSGQFMVKTMRKRAFPAIIFA